VHLRRGICRFRATGRLRSRLFLWPSVNTWVPTLLGVR
jgi:hypothetical protein